MSTDTSYLSAVKTFVDWHARAEALWVEAYESGDRTRMYAALAAFDQIMAGIEALRPTAPYSAIHQTYLHLQACAERVAHTRTSARDRAQIASADASLDRARKLMRDAWQRAGITPPPGA
jgi:hypothetical protein